MNLHYILFEVIVNSLIYRFQKDLLIHKDKASKNLTNYILHSFLRVFNDVDYRSHPKF